MAGWLAGLRTSPALRKGERMTRIRMRKTGLLMATMVLAVLLASVTALAATIKGDASDNELEGTPSRDVIIAFSGNDIVYALGGNDDVHHSYGNDYILGGSGDDTLRGGFGNDHIWGGPGRDLIDCAYVQSRDKGEDWDVAHVRREEYDQAIDVVVDCKTIVYEDDEGFLTTDSTRISSIDPITGTPTLTQ